MEIVWWKFWRASRGRLKTGWLVTAGLVAIYTGAIEPMNRYREMVTQGQTGLGAVAQSEPIWLRGNRRPMHLMLQKDVTVGRQRNGLSYVTAAATYGAGGGGDGALRDSEDRKAIRTGTMDLIVKSPRDTAEKIHQVTDRTGGFLVNSEINGGQDASSALLQIRVPAGKFDEVRTEIRKLGLRVESEKLNAEDVTKQYVDQAARLRNLRAQEVQYLGILKQAKTVKDTIDVSEKLDGVREEIETQQAEFNALSKQVETVALTITGGRKLRRRYLGCIGGLSIN